MNCLPVGNGRNGFVFYVEIKNLILKFRNVAALVLSAFFFSYNAPALFAISCLSIEKQINLVRLSS